VSLQTFNRCQQKSIDYSLWLLLIVVVFLPGQLNAQCGFALNNNQLVGIIDSGILEDCFLFNQSDCRQLQQTLSIADTRVSLLSVDLVQLQQALTRNRASLANTVGQLGKTLSAERHLSVFDLLRNAALTVFEVARIHVAIGSLRGELIMANHDRVLASAALTQMTRCPVVL